jgi:hypothetical protein
MTVSAIMVASMIAGCVSQPAAQVYLFHGPDPVLEQFVAASQACGYPHIQRMLGSHLEPIVVLDAPSLKAPEFDCAWSWAKAHERDGLTTTFSKNY